MLHSLAGQAATAVEAARFHQSADELSHTDALTHLPNRRRLELDLDLEIARSLRYNRPIACIMLDVDHFKKVNDVHGHQAGDEILSEFGSAFARSLRETDTAYRYGGEEFCVLLRETDADAAAIVAERLRVEIANRFAGNQGSAMVTASLGVAAIPSDAIDAKTLVAAADRALYAAKAAGRNCVVRATPIPRSLRVTTTRAAHVPTPVIRALPVVVRDESRRVLIATSDPSGAPQLGHSPASRPARFARGTIARAVAGVRGSDPREQPGFDGQRKRDIP